MKYSSHSKGIVMVSALLRRRHLLPAVLLCAIAFALFLCTIAPMPALAQNETGVRNYNPLYYAPFHMWMDSCHAMYQTEYPIIRSIPPLSTDMPFDIMLGYIYLDSLLRSVPSKQVNDYCKRWNNLNNDTLTWVLKAMYNLCDYNPIIFEQYRIETHLHHKRVVDTSNHYPMIGRRRNCAGDTITVQGPAFASRGLLSRYRSSIDDVSMLYFNVQKYAPAESEHNALYTLFNADYILRVKVIAIDSMSDKHTPSFFNWKLYRVIAQVLDTIKGKVYQPFNYNWLNRKEGNTHQTENYPLIAFEYHSVSYNILSGYDKVPGYDKGDPALMNNARTFTMHTGQEAVVFIRLQNHYISQTSDYFDVEVCPECSLNALPILDGQVRDINHIWSNSTLLSYPDWKQRVQQLIAKIQSRSY